MALASTCRTAVFLLGLSLSAESSSPICLLQTGSSLETVASREEIRSGILNAHSCQELVIGLFKVPAAELKDLCRRSVTSEAICSTATEVLAGRPMGPSMAQPICAALMSKKSPGRTAQDQSLSAALLELGAMEQRSGKTGRVASLDTALLGKNGLPRGEDYLVKSAVDVNAPAIIASSGDNSFPPQPSVDNTIQVPPDADGDFWNTPRNGWAKNGAPAAKEAKKA